MKKSDLKQLIKAVLTEINSRKFAVENAEIDPNDDPDNDPTNNPEFMAGLASHKKSEKPHPDDDRSYDAYPQGHYKGRLSEDKDSKNQTEPIKDDINNIKPVALTKAQKADGPAKGMSGLKKAVDKSENTQMGKEDKAITSTDNPKEKKESKKLPVKDSKSNTETDHFVNKKSTPVPPKNEKEESKDRPVGGHGADKIYESNLKKEIVEMIREALQDHIKEDSGNQEISVKEKYFETCLKWLQSIYKDIEQKPANTTEAARKISVLRSSITKLLSGVPSDTALSVNEMARTAVTQDEKGIVHGGINTNFRVQDPNSPTGWVLKGYGKFPDGTPVEAPKNTGKNYVKQTDNPNMGRPKTADVSGGNGSVAGDEEGEDDDSAPVDTSYGSLSTIAVRFEQPNKKVKTIGQFELNAKTPSGAPDNSPLKVRVMKFIDTNDDLLEFVDQWPRGVDVTVIPVFEKIEELWLDDKLNTSNNQLTLFIDPTSKKLKAK
jgi:hypothetical protein